MHEIIGDLVATDKTKAIARVAPYNDTIECSSRHPYPAPLLKAINRNAGSMLIQTVRDEKDPKVIWYYLLKINQPSEYCVELLQWYSERVKISVYRVHIAFDVTEILQGYSRQQIIEIFERLTHLRYRRTADDMYDDNGTLYSIKTAGRTARPYRNTGFYTSKPSKLTGEENAIHFEIKLERKRSTQKMVNEPKDLFTLNMAQFFAKEIAIKDIRPILETIIQRSIRLTKPHPLINTELRIRALVKRTECDHASMFARHFKYQFERIKHWDCIDVETGLFWATRDVQCDDEVQELHCLLPVGSKD